MFSFRSEDIISLAGWIPTFVAGIVACTPLMAATFGILRIKKKKSNVIEAVLCMVGLVLCIASLITESYNPFLYFRF